MPEALLGKHETQFFSPLPKWVKLQHFKSIFVTGVFIPQDNFQGTFLHSSISLQFFLVRLLCHTAKDCSNLLLTCNIWITVTSRSDCRSYPGDTNHFCLCHRDVQFQKVLWPWLLRSKPWDTFLNPLCWYCCPHLQRSHDGYWKSMCHLYKLY